MRIGRDIDTFVDLLVKVNLASILNHFLYTQYNNFDEFGPDVGHMLLYVAMYLFDPRHHVFATVHSNLPLLVLENISANVWQDEICDHLIAILDDT